MKDPNVYVEARGDAFPAPWGPVALIQMGRYDGKPMGWREIWEEFEAAYPGRWALQVFPPRDALVDEVNCYHLWVLPEGAEPGELRIDRGAPRIQGAAA